MYDLTWSVSASYLSCFCSDVRHLGDIIKLISLSVAGLPRTNLLMLSENNLESGTWIVDPINKALEVYTLGQNGFKLLGKFSGEERVGSEVLSELQFQALEVWK